MLQLICLGAPQGVPQPGVGKRHAGVQAPFFQQAEQVVSQARVLNPAEQFHDTRGAKFQMGDLVGSHDLEPAEVFLPVAVSRRR